MAQMKDGARIHQEKTGFQKWAQGGGDLLFLDSSQGAGQNGFDARHAFVTLALANAALQDNDTLIILPGHAETVTATATVSAANVKVVCPSGIDNPRMGAAFTAAGTIDIITVSGTDVTIEGMQFKHTGTTANASGVLGSTGSHRLTVRNCVVDDTAITTTFTGAGVELTAGSDDQLVSDCLFLDTKFGVYVKDSTNEESDRPKVEGCTCFVGQAAAYGVYALGGSGKIQGMQILDCKFIEADGDGSSATAAWDSTSATDGTQGPIKLDAAVDQYLISRCTASTALSTTFANSCTINAGAAGEIVESYTATATGSLTTIASDAAACEAAITALQVETSGTAGIVTWKAAAAPATGVSVSEVLRSVYDDTNELQTDWVNAGRLDTILDTVASDLVISNSDTTAIHTQTTTIASDTLVIESDVTAIEADTNELQTDWANGGRLDAIIDTIYSDTTAIDTENGKIYSDTGIIYSDTTAIASDTAKIETAVVLLSGGVADSGTTATVVDAAALTQGTDDYWKGAYIHFNGGTLAGQVRLITGFSEASDTITFAPAVTTAVTAGHTFDIIAGAGIYGGPVLTIASDLVQIYSDTTAIHSQTTAIEQSTVLLSGGVADSGTNATVVDAALLTQATDDWWKGAFIHFTSGTLAGQVRLVTAFAEGTDTITFAPVVTTAVTAGHEFELLASAGIYGGPVLTIASDIVLVYSDTTAIHSQATVLEQAGVLLSGTADSGTNATIVDAAALTQATDDWWKGCHVQITSGAAIGQVRLITGFSEAADEITFAPVLTAAITTETFNILPAAGIYGGPVLTIASDLVLVYSDTTVISSDTAVIETGTSNIYSDTTRLESDTTVISSDTAVIEVMAWRRAIKDGVDLSSGTADNIFTVTGEVECLVYVNVTTAITRAGGAVTLEVGTSDDTDLLLATVTDCRASIGDVFGGTDAAANINTRGSYCIVSGAAATTSVVLTTSIAADAGVVSCFCIYRPLSTDGAVAAA